MDSGFSDQELPEDERDWAQTYRDCGYEYDFICEEWHRPGYVCVKCFCADSPHPPPQCILEGKVISTAREITS